eukprot:240771_1
MADHALSALSESKVKQVDVVGRRGPVQAAFTNKELREVCSKIDGLHSRACEQELKKGMNAESVEEMQSQRAVKKKMQILEGIQSTSPDSSSSDRMIQFRFFLSPKEFRSDENGNVKEVVCEKTVSRDQPGNRRLSEPVKRYLFRPN